MLHRSVDAHLRPNSIGSEAMLTKVSVLGKQGRFSEIIRIAQNARTQEADRPASVRMSSAENIDSKAVSTA